MKNTRLFTGALGLCGVLLLGGCAVPVGPGYGGPGYGGGYYESYSRPYYSDPSPSIYIQGGSGYYDRPGYYGRPGYAARPDYDRRSGYDRQRPGNRPQPGNNVRPGNGQRPGAGAVPGTGGRPSGRPQAGPREIQNSPSLPIESQRILQERAQGGGS